MKKLLIFVIILLPAISFSQLKLKPGYYAVFFKDKNGSKFSISEPEKFLSQKAIQRREKYNIPITEQDLPVSEAYLDSLKKYGFKIWYTSKWLNAAVLKIEDSSELAKLSELVEKWDFLLPNYEHLVKDKPLITNVDSLKKELTKYKVKLAQNITNDTSKLYGKFEDEAYIVGIISLHNMGFRGRGIDIAIFDAGFSTPESVEVFRKAVIENRIIPVYDFVENDTNPYNAANHGTMALSTIVADSPYVMIGTAPEATFYLFRTEDESSEYKIEEFNWLVAAEWADSIGVDVITSSLGYSTFDDSTMNYSYEQMNGNYAISTLAADIAASKGIAVITSAGNEGDNEWKYITAPADGDSVIAVGASMSTEPTLIAYFSSIGPTSDGRLKPELLAKGYFTTVATKSGITVSFGTSFAAPQIAGVVACLLQAFPNRHPMEILKALQISGDKANNPDFKYGYGNPRAYIAYLLLAKYQNFDSKVYKLP